MSKGKTIPRSTGLELANMLARYLAPVCQRVEVAGSLRRGKERVGDIELVCIPNQVEDLFGGLVYQWEEIKIRLSRFKMLKGGDRYQQYDLVECLADVYVTTLEQWGVIFTLRTGSPMFSRKLVTPDIYGGYMPAGMWIEEGRLWRGYQVLETLTEEQLFEQMGLVWVKPEDRN